MDDILALVMGVLRKSHPAMTSETDFQTVGADSQTLLDIIVQVEDSTGTQFNPDAFDLNSAITPLKLSRAFKAPP